MIEQYFFPSVPTQRHPAEKEYRPGPGWTGWSFRWWQPMLWPHSWTVVAVQLTCLIRPRQNA